MCNDRSAVKFGVTFQLDMVATANCSRQKLESYVSCDKRIAKFNGINLVCETIAFAPFGAISMSPSLENVECLQQRLKEKIVSKIPIQLQQLDQQIQGQYQDFRVRFGGVLACTTTQDICKAFIIILVLLQRRFDHYIAQYTEILQTSLPSAPPTFPLPGPEVPIPTTSESVITQCREELASACSLHAQVLKHRHTHTHTHTNVHDARTRGKP